MIKSLITQTSSSRSQANPEVPALVMCPANMGKGDYSDTSPRRLNARRNRWTSLVQ